MLRTYRALTTEDDHTATSRCGAHRVDPGGHVLWQHRERHIFEWQRYLLECYQASRVATAHGGASPGGLQVRIRAAGPNARPRLRRTGTLAHRPFPAIPCQRGAMSGLRSSHTRAARRRPQQWRRPCEALHVHACRLAQVHTLESKSGQARVGEAPGARRDARTPLISILVIFDPPSKHNLVHLAHMALSSLFWAERS